MRLEDDQWNEVAKLLGIAKTGRLDMRGEHRLRYLLSRINHDALSVPYEELLHFGFVYLGLHAIQLQVDGRVPMPRFPWNEDGAAAAPA